MLNYFLKLLHNIKKSTYIKILFVTYLALSYIVYLFIQYGGESFIDWLMLSSIEKYKVIKKVFQLSFNYVDVTQLDHQSKLSTLQNNIHINSTHRRLINGVNPAQTVQLDTINNINSISQTKIEGTKEVLKNTTKQVNPIQTNSTQLNPIQPDTAQSGSVQPVQQNPAPRKLTPKEQEEADFKEKALIASIVVLILGIIYKFFK